MIFKSLPLFKATGSIQLSLIRRANGQYVRGRWVDATPTAPVIITANIQPTTGKDMLLLPEAERLKQAVKLFSEQEVRASKEGSHSADQFMYNGQLYEVRRVKKWDMGVLNHYHAIAVAVENLAGEVE